MTTVKKMSYSRHQIDASIAETSRPISNIDKTIQISTLINSANLTDSGQLTNYATINSSYENKMAASFNATAPHNIKYTNYPQSLAVSQVHELFMELLLTRLNNCDIIYRLCDTFLKIVAVPRKPLSNGNIYIGIIRSLRKEHILSL